MTRYSNSPIMRAGISYGTPSNIDLLRNQYAAGNLNATQYVLKEGERLDHIAGKFLGDSTMWWTIAAISGIGWGLQCPPGTVINIPNRAQLDKL